MQEKIEFTASLPPVSSAIEIHGIGDGARIKLDIPQSDIVSVVKLAGLTGKAFKVTIETEE